MPRGALRAMAAWRRGSGRRGGGDAVTPQAISPALADVLTLEEVGRLLKLSPKTVKRLGRDDGLPLFRLVPNGPLFARSSKLDEWISRRAIPQNGYGKTG